ncbi:hypothetical protein A3D04_02775 [Candidatus Curtissbacteria bacterium RIFCSPHIGHO2_02_FULL_40_16b]|uniref:tRNA N6-adenosine threonylcarbamoyltransferase n=1 Tax=Candidatus Curtissbacteria bacterium RIFCSPHIGHO2_02_FULL_40_16b TaxID=1797714 RepID=A0A1F5G907_9BACT|nr:MAG: hypothetical protein A3D04_02775 [Candidatus Curtissbacteria bacterium RIFCSPHIGHO2_02_FULL_40_16b]
MIILGIETTCDETGAAVVQDGRLVLSNILASSANLHEKYGGVVPEVAAREQVRSILPVIAEAIGNAAQTLNSKLETRNNLQNPEMIKWAEQNIDVIAVAHGPGLIGSLLIGVETAKTLALAWEKPLIGVNHLVGHIYANWISLEEKPKFPFVGLVVSGGHTDLILIRGHGEFKLIGTTLDDSAGEAFDKVARHLGLSYPGGPEIENAAQQLTADKEQLALKFPRPLINSKDFNFSFSGLKTAVVNYTNQISNVSGQLSAIATEFQDAVVDVLITKSLTAAKKFSCNSIVVGGGVAANSHLRSKLTAIATRDSIKVNFPSKSLSVDNGAMIAAAAYFINKLPRVKNPRFSPILSFGSSSEIERPRKYVSPSLHPRPNIQFLAGFSRSENKKVDPLKLSANPSLHF